MSEVQPRAGHLQPAFTKGMGESEEVEGRPFVSAPFGKALVAAAAREARLVGLTADLAKYTDILPFAEAFPDRFFNVGMAEQALIGAAAGSPKPAFCPLRPLMPSSPPAALTTSSPSRSPRARFPLLSPRRFRASPRAMAQPIRASKIWRL